MRTHFVGRRRELADLETTLAEVRERQGQLVVLVGEAGIGKTRTVRQFVERAGNETVAVHWGRCHDESDVPAFWPWTQLIRSYAQSVDSDVLREDMGSHAGIMAQLVPTLRDQLPALPEPPDSNPLEARFRLFDAVAELFRGASHRRPLTLVIDDLHWADETSLQLLNFLAINLRDAAVLMLATARRFRAQRDSRREALFAELTRVGRRVRLGGLDVETVAEMVSDVTDAEASPEMIAAIHERTRGNPFFVDELMRLMLQDGSLPDVESVQIPHEVRSAILRRLDHLDTRHRTILGAAAVIGREFDIALLEQVALTPSADLLDLLESPALGGIVDPTTGVRGRYEFYHALVRETLYAEIEPSHRVALHRRIGEAITKTALLDAGEQLAGVAYHFLEARRGGETVPAADYAQRAGDHALELLAYEQASSHYRDALDALRFEDHDEARSLELLLSLGEAQSMAGEARSARTTFEHASSAARRQGSDHAFARAALGRARAAETGWGDRKLVPLLQEALGRLPEQDSALRAGILGRLGMAIYHSSDAKTHANAGVEMARRLGDDRALARALICRHYVMWGQDLAEERLTLMQEAIALSERSGDGPSVLEAASWAIQDLLELGRIDEADRALRRYATRAAELRLPRYLWHSTMIRATRATMSGDFERAERLSVEALRHRGPDAPNAAIIHSVQLYCLYREQGRLASLEAPMSNLAADNPAVPIWRCGFAALFAEIGDRKSAKREFERFAADEFRTLPEDANRPPSLALLAEVCSFLEDRERAETLDALLAPMTDVTVVVATSAGYFGPMARFRGLLATLLGRYSDAETLLTGALEQVDRSGARPVAARTRFDLAQMLRARGDPDDVARAGSLLEQATETAASLGMTGLLERCQRLGANGTQPTADASDDAGPRTVFRREGDYWTVALGNEIASVKDSIGLGYIAQMLREPSREFHVLDLCAPPTEARDPGDAGEHMDPQARAAYRARLADLRDELAEAERWNDSARAARARHEIDALGAELARAVGLGGRSRRAASSTERARVNTTRAIRRALSKITEMNPVLGRRLSSCIRTGTFCCYEPDPVNPLEWEF